jgi:adenylosuccinate lyase
MIPRYSREQMSRIWRDETKYQIWLDIELHACDAMVRSGKVPAEAAAAIRKSAPTDMKRLLPRINELEQQTRHDVIAFLTAVAEKVGAETARYLHQGMTSSDVVDTAFSVQLTRATDILLADLTTLLATLKEAAFKYRKTACIGRSHGVHAEPTTFGLKLAQAYAEFRRGKVRLERARDEIATCAISGAVGTYAYLDGPEVETYVAGKLGLRPETISTQVIPRDRHAMFFATLGVIAGSIERLATEIRHLQRTEVREVEEPFAKGQKGSSAMPHKRNPILAENLTGLARMVRSSVVPALENVALWHERDISHSSVERMIAPDATITLDFALHRLNGLIGNLIVLEGNMDFNLKLLDGLNFSQDVLLALTQAGAGREFAYGLVQRNAMLVWDELADPEKRNKAKNLRDRLLEDEAVREYLSEDEIRQCFALDRHMKHVDQIFRRVFDDNSYEQHTPAHLNEAAE